MNRLIISLLLCSSSLTIAFPLIPLPTSVEPKDGSFALNGKWEIVTAGTSDFLKDHLSSGIKKLFPHVPETTLQSHGTIKLSINPQADASYAYTLTVAPENIVLDARDEAGAFYGIQTLLQLIQPNAQAIPACVIRDAPRFGWRGLMLDSSRHIQSIEEIKLFLDQMAHYKFNVFHWHLTDDQGWRIEIKSRPKLTEIGAWRVHREGIWWSRPGPEPDEKASYGGFYTQEQIKEIIAYAALRHITIVPEIDIPGHAMAILAAYPELSTTGGPFQVNPGSQFYGTIENTLDPSNPETFVFINDVLSEVAKLFPNEYIHMGGDECPKNFWANDADCQELMKREGHKDPHELQSWFIKRIEKIIQANGKKLIGWDEILQGGLAETATVMSWQGKAGGIAAAKMGRHVIMSPSPAYYLDLYQGHPEIEPATYGMARLKDTYLFDPTLPADMDSNLLLGIQGNIWTEEIPTFRHAQYMTWPRAFAIAEEAWSQRSAEKDWPAFVKRVEAHFARFDAMNWNYSRSIYDPAITLSADKQSVVITPEIDGLQIHYTFDDTEPDATYPICQGPLPIPKGASHLRTRSYRDGKPIGRTTLITLANIEKEKRTP
jgi:hexosaminidase